MNWINRLFGKKQQSATEIWFDELPVWLESISGRLSDDLGRQAYSLYSDIRNALEEIKRSTSLLEEARPEGRFHLKMVKIATSNRDNIVKQVRILVENTTIPETADVKTVLGFHERTMQSLTVCLENITKSYRYVKMVFLEESKQVITDVNMLGRYMNQLAESIKEKKDLLDAVENASKTIQIIRDTRSDIETERSSIKDKEEKAAPLENELRDKQIALTRLRDSHAWKEYLHYRDELAVLKSNAEKKESEINGLILRLNKPFNRLKQLSESGRYTLAPHVRECLYLCLSDPKSVDPEFFVEFRNIAESNALNLTSEKHDKVLEQLRTVTSSFDSYQKQYYALVQDIEKKKDEISRLDINQDEANITGRIAVLQDELAASGQELDISVKRLASLTDDLELKKQELQQIIYTIDSRMRILF